MKNKITNFFLSLSLGLGTIFLLSPFALYWWIHGDYDRYIWIINGPYPYSDFGGGPFQLAMCIELFLLGALFIVISLLGSKFLNHPRE